MKTVESGCFAFEMGDDWRCRKAKIVGWFHILLGFMGVGAIATWWFGAKLREATFPDWLLWLGITLLLFAMIKPTLYNWFWAKREFKNGLPRVGLDLLGTSLIVTGPSGQWLHITSDRLRSTERPMDSHELEERCKSYYGERLESQGMLESAEISTPLEFVVTDRGLAPQEYVMTDRGLARRVNKRSRSRTIHYAVYRLSNGLHKKYSVYLEDPPREPIEVIITAKIGRRTSDMNDLAFEQVCDELARSVRVSSIQNF